MYKLKFAMKTLAVLAAILTAGSIANAQATRTWVSGVGDDANPCSRTAPCKTFAGAISKTAPGGEIDVLDPGGFGAVTITKSIRIEADGLIAGVLVSGTNAIVIAAGPNDIVQIRGLTFNGLGTGLTAIKVNSAGAVHVEECYIYGFTQIGIDFTPSAVSASTSQLHVRNTVVKDNLGASSGGIRYKPGANVTASGEINNCKLANNQFGLRVEDNSTVTATNTNASNNTGAGFIAVSGGGAAVLNLTSCAATSNGAVGVKADANAAALVRIAGCTIAGNAAGIVSNLGSVKSYGNNFNSDSGTPVGPNLGQQ